MKKLSLTFAMLVCVVFLTACNDQAPLIEIEAKVSPVSDEEYRKIGATEDLIEPKQEDFKIFEFNFNMEHTDSVKDRKIEMYDFNNLPQVLNGIDGIARFRNSGGHTQDNETENFASYRQEVVFYTKGLSEDDIRKAFSNEKVSVSWTNNKNKQMKKEYNLSDLIEFSSIEIN